MLLAIDVGNTNTKFAIWDGQTWRAQWRASTDTSRTGRSASSSDVVSSSLSRVRSARGPSGRPPWAVPCSVRVGASDSRSGAILLVIPAPFDPSCAGVAG